MKALTLGLAVAGVLAIGALTLTGATALGMDCCGGAMPAAGQEQQHGAAAGAAGAQGTVAQRSAAHVTAAIAAIDAAAKALQSGDHIAVARELANARKLLEAVQKEATLASAAPTGFANAKCPIMGSPIDPAKVTASLTRVYKGKKIAFCCGGCPGQWDKLTDAQKDAKLQ